MIREVKTSGILETIFPTLIERHHHSCIVELSNRSRRFGRNWEEKTMKSLLAGLPLLMIATASAAQWEPYPEMLRIEGKGEGAWNLKCQMQTKKGDPVAREFTGRGKKALGFSLDEPIGGSCAYVAAPDKPLTISLRSPMYVCPLASAVDKPCQQTFPAGATGTFDVKKKGGR
ncbi:hypothetical protein [Hyphomonas sp.]|uniref:hypothetical protein n=1 Tax=Hyphomonas sp. TaxID=87 RepID=UPI0025C3E1D6|nr:hypothetical protein [Hyphomonas sp.]